MLKKNAALLLILTLISTVLFSACNGKADNADMGSINEITIDRTGEEKTQTLFPRQRCPFSGYSMQKVKYYSAQMTIEVPSSWLVETSNPSQIKITVPLNDANFPGNVFYIQSIYDYSVDEDEMASEASDISYIYKPFMTYIEGLSYSIAGTMEGTLRRWRGAWDHEATPDFVEDSQLAVTDVQDNEVLYDNKNGDLIAQNVSFIATFYKWQGFPVMISTFAAPSQKKDAVKMTEFIMSTSTYRQPTVSNTKDVKCGKKIQISLPSEFETTEESGNVFAPPFNSTYASSGIAIGIYSVPDYYTDREYLTDEDITGIAKKTAYELMDQRYKSEYVPLPNLTGEGESSFAGEDLSLFFNCSFVTNEDVRKAAVSPYGAVSINYMDMFIISKGDKGCYLIASLFSRQQADLAAAIEKLAVKSLTIS